MKNEMIIYHTEDGRAQIHLHLENGTIWLNQSEIACGTLSDDQAKCQQTY